MMNSAIGGRSTSAVSRSLLRESNQSMSHVRAPRLRDCGQPRSPSDQTDLHHPWRRIRARAEPGDVRI